MSEKMQKLVSILLCGQCPYKRLSVRPYCVASDDMRGIAIREDSSPPEACPLRKNDFVLTLAEGV